MGVPYRRYNSTGFSLGGFWRGVPPAIKTLLIIMTAVFLAQVASGVIFGAAGLIWINYHLGLVPLAVVKGLRIWQPFTYIFLHGGLWHLLVNLFVLWMFGADIERVWGERKFYKYFFICGVGAGLIDVAVNWIPAAFGRSVSTVPTIGASGAIFGVLIAAAMVFPDRRVWLLPLPITLSMRVYVAIMVGIEFFLTLDAPGDNISHFCHLGGILVGYLYLRRGSFFYKVRNAGSDWKRRRTRRKFEVYMRDHSKDAPPRSGPWVN
ncbi:MAG TPA: rhomboid family intramembrane serine protease [Candidatus Acidoferrales bacterium]|jgi:membrane associated rhomboid family serine protease|nr:rhomboid family intramembrane serine protease [Candidatus Acidoferrales bacterium]